MEIIGKRKREDFENNDYNYESKLEKNELLLLNNHHLEILKQIWYKEYQLGKEFLKFYIPKIDQDIDIGKDIDNLINGI